MTLNEQKLKTSLIEYIVAWIDENEDRETYVHDSISEDMADAAFAVFLAIKKKEQWLLDNGVHKAL